MKAVMAYLAAGEARHSVKSSPSACTRCNSASGGRRIRRRSACLRLKQYI